MIVGIVVVIALAAVVLVMFYHHQGLALLLGLMWTMAVIGLIAAFLNCPKWAIFGAVVLPFFSWLSYKVLGDPCSNPFKTLQAERNER
jgi:hypothetical protein